MFDKSHSKTVIPARAQRSRPSLHWRLGPSVWLLLVLQAATALTLDVTPDPICIFNQLCTCSGSLRNFRSVQCVGVPLSSVPYFNASLRLSHLLLDGNGLRVLDDSRFVNSGMERLHVVRNLLTRIPDAAFNGVTRSLKELDLSENQLCTIPRRALKPLQVLKRLNLNDNAIVEVRKEDISGLEQTLEQLSLARNRLSQLPADVFSDLRQLELLDLRGNLLTVADAASFRGSLPRLVHLLLSDNLLDALPRAALLNKRSLRMLDLSGNCLVRLGDGATTSAGLGTRSKSSTATSLEHLILDNNQIRDLEPGALEPYTTIQRLSLNNNPLSSLANHTFRGVVVRELHLEDCDLKHVALHTFTGLESELRVLNLASNRLSDGKSLAAALTNMTSLVNVNLTGNGRLAWLPTGVFTNCSMAMKFLQLDSPSKGTMGGGGVGLLAEGLSQLQNLRNLSLSKVATSALRGTDFPNPGLHLDRLSLRGAGLQAINADAFHAMPQITHLTLDANQIGHLNEAALDGLADSLETLDMSGALSHSIETLPVKFLQPLTSLQQLHMSNNRLKRLPVDGLKTMGRLRSLNLQDNVIDTWPPGFLSAQNNPDLYALWLSFNQLRQLDTMSFSGYKQLRYLYLDDNVISTVRKEAVANLDALEFLDLQSNRLSVVEVKAFQGLPNLRLLNLAHNRLVTFSLDVLDSVGIMTSLEVDLSHNLIQNLTATSKFPSSSAEIVMDGGDRELEMSIMAVEVMRLSHNNISSVHNYFRPLLSTLLQLHLDHNTLTELTRSVVGDLPHLQLLKLNHNHISRADSDSLDHCASLQVLRLDHNQLGSLPQELLSDTRNLRHLDLSFNHLDSLPDTLFRQLRGLEHLNLGSNLIARFPTGALWSVALSLRHLDISNNKLFYLSNDIFHTFDQLITVDLSNNELKQLDDGLFSRLPRLCVLNLAFNNWTAVESSRTFSFNGAPPALEELDLSGGSLTAVPLLDMPNLLRLNLSSNNIVSVPATALRQLTKLRYLDLSDNHLPEVPSEPWVYMPHLQFLSLSHNPIRSIANSSLLGLNHLNELHIKELSLEMVDAGFLGAVKNLRELHTSSYHHTVPSFKLASLLRSNNGLITLHLRVDNASRDEQKPPPNSNDPRQHSWPCKLRTVIASGRFLQEVGEHTLGTNRFQSRTLNLKIRNSSVTGLSQPVWKSMMTSGNVRQLQLEVAANGMNMLADPSEVAVSGTPFMLTSLAVSGERWRCDCSVGWVEHWMRRQRQEMCGENESARAHQQCRQLVDDIRPVLCGGGSGNRSLIEVLKMDLDCGLVSAAPRSIMSVKTIAATLALLLCTTISYS